MDNLSLNEFYSFRDKKITPTQEELLSHFFVLPFLSKVAGSQLF